VKLGVVNIKQNYLEKAEIVNVTPLDIQETTLSIIVRVKGKELKCFVSDSREKGYFSVEEKCEVFFSLMTWSKKLVKARNEIKEIRTEELKGTPNHCFLSGKIIDFLPLGVNYKYGIVDCGIFVAVEIPTDSELKIGDYITAEGRLDTRKVKEENV